MRVHLFPVLLGLIAILILPSCGMGIEEKMVLEPAQDEPARQAEEAATAEPSAEETVAATIEDLVSPICPVSGVDLRDAGIGATANHNGKLYGFSCPHCKASFLENPQQYLTQAGETPQDIP